MGMPHISGVDLLPLEAISDLGGGSNEFGKVNILLVDDTPENLVAWEAILSCLDQNLVKARSGSEALHCLLRQEFAVILLDVNMPDLNGFQTAALIRQRKSSEHTPIIFITAISTTEMYSSRGYALGAVDYMSTPVIPEVLRTKVAVFVELWKKKEEVKRQAEKLRDIEEAEHKRRLMEATQRLEFETTRNRFFKLSIELLSIAGFDGSFKQLNPTWQAVLGFTEEELKAKPFVEFVHAEDRAATIREIERVRRTDVPVYFENRFYCKNGGHRWLGWTAASFPAEELFYFFARDITDRKRSEAEIRELNAALARRAAELEKANQELEKQVLERKRAEGVVRETNAALEAFAYSVSHDLRAPLRAMQGFAQALLEDYADKLDENGKCYADRIIASANRMDTLIEDLLQYSRVSYNALQLQAVQVEHALSEALRQLEQPIRQAKGEVELLGTFLPVVGHHQTLVQILCNLISNGIKFVESGVIPRIRIRMEPLADRGRIWVEDNGIGVAPEFHSRIFRVFERLHGLESYPGTGIGLAIVRKGLERMGGAVGLESAEGRGSSFWIELPLAQPKFKDGEHSERVGEAICRSRERP